MIYFQHLKTPIGWFYSNTFNYWQKTNGRVVCYISPLISGFQAQLYIRGEISVCELEVRTDNRTLKGIDKLFEISEEWLHLYKDGNLSTIQEDPYAIANPNGVWRKNLKDKEYWVVP